MDGWWVGGWEGDGWVGGGWVEVVLKATRVFSFEPSRSFWFWPKKKSQKNVGSYNNSQIY